jgi:hypothetical protein
VTITTGRLDGPAPRATERGEYTATGTGGGPAGARYPGPWSRNLHTDTWPAGVETATSR